MEILTDHSVGEVGGTEFLTENIIDEVQERKFLDHSVGEVGGTELLTENIIDEVEERKFL